MLLDSENNPHHLRVIKTARTERAINQAAICGLVKVTPASAGFFCLPNINQRLP